MCSEGLIKIFNYLIKNSEEKNGNNKKETPWGE